MPPWRQLVLVTLGLGALGIGAFGQTVPAQRARGSVPPAAPAPAGLQGSAGPRHAGIVQAVDATRGVVTLSELAEAGRLRVLTVQVAPETRILRARRLPADQLTDLRHAFQEEPIPLAALRPGDFVVVELARRGETVASTLTLAVPWEGGARPR